MKVRRPVSDVFNAFIDPAVTTKFWFTKSDGKLEIGKTVIWEWEMYGASTPVTPLDIRRDERISIEWGDPATYVDFEFTRLSNDETYVEIRHYGFRESGDELLAAVRDSTGGFTTVVDGLKCWLEHGIALNLILDKFTK